MKLSEDAFRTEKGVRSKHAAAAVASVDATTWSAHSLPCCVLLRDGAQPQWKIDRALGVVYGVGGGCCFSGGEREEAASVLAMPGHRRKQAKSTFWL